MDIRQSLDAIQTSSEIVGERFYERFLQRFPEAQPLFRNVDLARQAALLTSQLTVIECYHRTQSPSAAAYLQVLGTRHRHRHVPQDSYPGFRDVLLETLAEFHGQAWDHELATQWRDAIDDATQKMFDGYQQDFRV